MPTAPSPAQPIGRPRGPVWPPSALAGAVLLVTFATFFRATSNGFVDWDDSVNFVTNESYRGLGWTQIRWMLTTTHMGHWIPLTWLTLGLDHVLWGMDPWGYHLTSVILHSVNAVLCFVLALGLLRAALGGAVAPTGLCAGAVTAALLFALHPLRVESVAWVTERRDVVMGLFTLLTVLAYLEAHRRGEGGRLHAAWRWAAVGLFGLALAAKSLVVGLPLVLLVMDLWPLGRGGDGAARWPRRIGRLVLEKWPFLLQSAAIGGAMLGVAVHRGLVTTFESLDPLDRIAVSAYGAVFYLWKTFSPWPLSPLYTLMRPVDPLTARYLIPAAVVVALTAASILGARRWPAGLALWASYLTLAGPVLGLIHNGPQIVADRYSYLACLPWALLGGSGVAWCWQAGRSGRIARALGAGAAGGAAAVLGLLAVLSFQQIGVWRDSVTLWRQAAAVDEDSDIPLFSLGWALANQGRLDEAREHFVRSLARVPEHLSGLRAQFLLHIGIVEQRAGRAAEAERLYRGALALDPEHPVAMIRLGSVLLGRGEVEAARRAFAAAARGRAAWERYKVWELRAAIALVPPALLDSRGELAFGLGLLLQEFDALEEAEEHFRLAATLLPGHASAWNNLGVTYAIRRRYAEALQAFLEALRAQPAHPDACRNGQRAAEALGRAVAELDRCRALGS